MYEFIYEKRLNTYLCANCRQTHTYRLCTEYFKHFSIHDINIHDITLLICIKSIIFFVKRIRNSLPSQINYSIFYKHPIIRFYSLVVKSQESDHSPMNIISAFRCNNLQNQLSQIHLL